MIWYILESWLLIFLDIFKWGGDLFKGKILGDDDNGGGIDVKFSKLCCWGEFELDFLLIEVFCLIGDWLFCWILVADWFCFSGIITLISLSATTWSLINCLFNLLIDFSIDSLS